MVLFTGKTIEEAVVKGLQELELSRADAEIKVISKEKKGFFGFGRKLAEVDIEAFETTLVDEKTSLVESFQQTEVVIEKETFQEQMVIPTSEEIVETTEPVAETPVASSSDFDDFVSSEFKSDEAEDSVSGEEVAVAVADYVEKIIYEMDVEATLLTKVNRRHVSIQIETPEPGRVIGYHGKVLKSLQLLAQNFIHDKFPRYFSVSLNVHDYLEHRMETLIDFTKKVSTRVLETGKEYIMDPMSNSERKTVHKTISQIDGVESYSEGNDPNRYVVIVARGNN